MRCDWPFPNSANSMNQILIGHIRERKVVRKKAAVCGEDHCVTSLKTAVKETSKYDTRDKNLFYCKQF